MPPAAGGSTAWRQNDTALIRRTPRSILIMAAGADEPLRLAGAAVTIWDELERATTDAALVDRVASRTGTEGSAIRDDVVATRAALGHIGAITEAR